MATYNCPSQDVVPLLPCLGKSEIDTDVYAVIDIITERVNQFLSIMGITPPIGKIKRATDAGTPAFDCHVLSNGGTYKGVPYDGLGNYINMLINTGWVYKQAKDGDGVLFPIPPISREEVETLMADDCNAFWNSWDEIYDCMRNPLTNAPLNKDMRRKVFEACPTPASEMCFNEQAWLEMILSLQCMANYKCFPACQCPICTTAGCQPCGKCLTIQVMKDGSPGRTALKAIVPASGCIGTMSGRAFIVDTTGAGVSDYPYMDYLIYLAKGYLTYQFRIWDALYDPGGGGELGRWLYHQVALWHFGDSAPDIICSDVPDDPAQIMTDYVEPVYWYDDRDPGNIQTVDMGTIVISMAIGFPICSHPWFGVYREYHIVMGSIPICTECGRSEALPQNGNMILTYGGDGPLTLANSTLSHLERNFYATVTFDVVRCAFKLELSCSWGTYFKGYLLGCGGPDGLYITDPDFMTPCQCGNVVIAPGWLS